MWLCYYPFSNIVSHKITLITTRKPTTFAIFERTQYWTLRRTNTIYSMDCANFTLCRDVFSFLPWRFEDGRGNLQTIPTPQILGPFYIQGPSYGNIHNQTKSISVFATIARSIIICIDSLSLVYYITV